MIGWGKLSPFQKCTTYPRLINKLRDPREFPHFKRICLYIQSCGRTWTSDTSNERHQLVLSDLMEHNNLPFVITDLFNRMCKFACLTNLTSLIYWARATQLVWLDEARRPLSVNVLLALDFLNQSDVTISWTSGNPPILPGFACKTTVVNVLRQVAR
jgi:hypothetical protein